jgi:hypothetical protein
MPGAADAAARARAVLVRTVETAVLAALSGGPLNVSALRPVAKDLSRKRFWRIVDVMHRAGSIKRLSVRQGTPNTGRWQGRKRARFA